MLVFFLLGGQVVGGAPRTLHHFFLLLPLHTYQITNALIRPFSSHARKVMSALMRADARMSLISGAMLAATGNSDRNQSHVITLVATNEAISERGFVD